MEETRKIRRQLRKHAEKTSNLEDTLTANIRSIIEESQAREDYVARTLRGEHQKSRSETLQANRSLNGRDRTRSPEGWNRRRGSGSPRVPPLSGNAIHVRVVDRTDSTPSRKLRHQARLPTRDTIISRAELTDPPSVHRVNTPTDAESAVIRTEPHGSPMTPEGATTPEAETTVVTVPEVGASTVSQSSRDLT